MDDCTTGDCPPKVDDRDTSRVKLSEGSGGKEMHRIISEIKSFLTLPNNWKHTDDDSALIKLGDKNIFFTSDSFIVTPVFFPGGDIGKIAFCGTVNDLCVMGAKPLGISLSLVIEEGFPKESLHKIMKSIGELSEQTKIPIVTGDTKVMEKKSLDGIIINTSGIGLAEAILDKPLSEGDKIIVSGGIGEHGTALLSKRFELESDIKTDSKPLLEEFNAIRNFVKQAKDITRGGLASILNEMADKNKMGFFVYEEHIPLLKEVRALTEILGIDAYSLACEGRFACIVPKENAESVVNELRKFNPMACVIGEVKAGKGVIVQTKYGKKILSIPSGNIVPRIC